MPGMPGGKPLVLLGAGRGPAMTGAEGRKVEKKEGSSLPLGASTGLFPDSLTPLCDLGRVL